MDLPAPHLRVLPELAAVAFEPEPLATCAACAMAPRVPSSPGEVAFTAPARCCTYHPRLANFLAGQALRRGGPGAGRVRARMAQGAGVDRMGISPPSGRRRAEAFGRDAELTCPYWLDGEALACGIHADRDGVCRTWHCKVARGERGQAAWNAAAHLLTRLESRLAEWCAARVPGGPSEAYYVACAEAVDAASDADLAAVRSPGLLALLRNLRERVAARDAPLPDVVQPRVLDWVVRDDGVAMASFSPYDRALLPPWIFELLARLDGTRPWREAVAEAARALGRPVPEGLVAFLWDRGLVGPPVPLEGSDEPVVAFLPE